VETDLVVVEAPTGSAVRSPADVLRVICAAVLLLALVLVQWLFGNTLTQFVADLFVGLRALPEWIVNAIAVGTRVLAIVLVGGGFVVTLLRGRYRFLLTVALAAVLAGGLNLLFDEFGPEPSHDIVDVTDAVGPLGDDAFPSAAGVAVIAAIVTASAPWIERRWRRAGWLLVFGVATTRFMTTPISFDTLRALLIGWLAGAFVVAVLGGPSRRPTGHAIAAGLARVGVPLRRIEQASVDARGSTPYFAETADGHRLFVKALGDDERSADLLFRIYRYATRRQFGDERPFSTLRRAVEHEAFVALTARDAGIRTPQFLALATAEPNAFVLGYEAIAGRSLDRLGPDEFDDGVVDAIWEQVRLMRAHGIAHRDLRLANVFLADDGAAWAIDFGFSEVAASDLLLANDVAELTTSLASVIGPQRAVQSAVAAVGPAGIEPALDRLQLWSLSGATRAACKAQDGLLDGVRREMKSAVPA
jgi:undecaprenyl-diphosphatase